MRESIGGAWLLGIVMVFMAVFIAYIAITINYSAAYKLKTKMVTVIEQYEGPNPTSLAKLQGLINASGYRATFPCTKGNDGYVLGVLDGHPTMNPSTPQNYCITREVRYAKDGEETKYYYDVEVTFKFNLPILGDLFNFRVSGETNAIYYPNDKYFKN